MKEYYFIIGKEQKGPFSLEELKVNNLTNETLVWTEEMDGWEKLKNLPDLRDILKVKNVPPPLPSEFNETIEENASQLSSLNPMIPSKKILTRLIIWVSFHLFALLMSYSRIDIFNDRSPKSDKFWPFVDYFRGITNVMRIEDFKVRYFNGIFAYYDWTEFAFYVGGALIIFILSRLLNKK